MIDLTLTEAKKAQEEYLKKGEFFNIYKRTGLSRYDSYFLIPVDIRAFVEGSTVLLKFKKVSSV